MADPCQAESQTVKKSATMNYNSDPREPLLAKGPEDLEALLKHEEKEAKTCLQILDKLDREMSGKVHECKAHTSVECIILLFAAMFNRGYGFTSFITSYLYA